MNPQHVAWLVTLLCLLLSVRFALAFLRDAPRLFTAMALFACVWAHILGFYGLHELDFEKLGASGIPEPTAGSIRLLAGDVEKLMGFISNITSFLLVYAGALLMLEARSEKKHPKKATVPLQSIALAMLLLIALPRAFSVPGPDGESVGLNQAQVGVIVSVIVDLLACVSIVIGAWAIGGGVLFGLLALVMAVYAALLVMLDLNRWGANEYLHMSDFYRFSFSGLKFALTVLFGSIVAGHGMPPQMREKGLPHWVMHFFYLA